MQLRTWMCASVLTVVAVAGCGGGGGGGGGGAPPGAPTSAVLVVPGQVELGQVAAGTTATADVSVSNVDPARTVTVTSAAIEAGGSSAFSVAPTQPLPVALAPGQATIVRVRFAPTAGGDFVGVLAIATDLAGSFRVPLHGAATSPGGGGGGGNGGDGGGTATFPDGRPLELITRSSSGQPMEGESTVYKFAISGGGRFVAFDSMSSTLVPGDVNGQRDVFVRDRLLGTTTRVSVTETGADFPLYSHLGGISADGRYVAFTSARSTTGNNMDLYVKDRSTGALSRLLHDDDVVTIDGISGDGRLVVFTSSQPLSPQDLNTESDVYVWNRLTGAVTLVSAKLDGTGAVAGGGQISRDGGHVAFVSGSALVAGDAVGNEKVYVRNLATGTTARVDAAAAEGSSGSPRISRDGRYVAFLQRDGSGEDQGAFVRDTQTGDLRNVVANTGGDDTRAISLSGDGRFLAFWGDLDGPAEGGEGYYVLDMSNGERHRITSLRERTDDNEDVPFATISSGGTYVAFLSLHALLPEDTHQAEDTQDVYAAPVPQ